MDYSKKIETTSSGIDVAGSVDISGAGTLVSTGSTTQPLTFKNNGRTGTYNQSCMYAHQNNTSGNSNNGIVFEVGRLTDSSSAEIGKFTIATRGGNIATITDADGIKFNGDTAAANALDDYEEGTFTPVYNYSGRSFNYYLQTGSYVKIGKTVHFILGIGTSSTSGSGTSGPVKIDGLPFASNARSAVAIRATNFASDPARTATVESGATFMELIKQTSSGTTDMTGSSLSTSNFGNIVYAAGHYETNS